jgi:transposase
VQKGLERLSQWVKRHKLEAFVRLTLTGRTLTFSLDEEALAQSALLDGCYTLETDVSAKHMDMQTVEARYRDLQKVERNFRTIKTGFLEIRPVFLRKGTRTKGHVLIALLALKVTRLFEEKLHRAFSTTEEDPHALRLDEALIALSRLTYLHYETNGQCFARLPRLDTMQSAIGSVSELLFQVKASQVNSVRLMNKPITMSCIRIFLEKHIVFRTNRLMRVRKVRFFRSIFWVFSFPIM